MTAAVLAVILYRLGEPSWAIFLGVLGVVSFVGLLKLRRIRRVTSLEEKRDRIVAQMAEPARTTEGIGRKRELLQQRDLAAKHQLQNIEAFRSDIAGQRPLSVLQENEVETGLNDALNHLKENEWKAAQISNDDEIVTFGPLWRWIFETDRKELLDHLRPSVYSIARRGGYYARYDVQLIFIHKGQLTLVQAFYDMILGEFRNISKTHIFLKNLTYIKEDVSEDFDVKHRLRDAIKLSYRNNEPDGTDTPEVSEVDDLAEEVSEVDLISVVQTRSLRFDMGQQRPLELRFVISGQREGLITQLRYKRELEEASIARLSQVSDSQQSEEHDELQEHTERLQRLLEDEERVRRSATSYNIDQMVTQILVNARRAGGQS